MPTTSHDQIFADQLRARARALGPVPLVTYYDAASGERTELSAVSFLNWVDKTSNLLIDEISLDEGDTVALLLARSAPGHWITLIWEAAAWQIGATVMLDSTALDTTAADSTAADVSVVGPDWETAYGPAGENASSGEWVACALHPLGLGFSEKLPDGLMDFALEVRAQPDVFGAAPVPHEAPAWIDGDRELSQNDLVTTTTPSSERTLVRAGDPWATVRDALIAPVLGGGSSVVIAGDMDDDQLARLIETERVTSSPESPGSAT